MSRGGTGWYLHSKPIRSKDANSEPQLISIIKGNTSFIEQSLLWHAAHGNLSCPLFVCFTRMKWLFSIGGTSSCHAREWYLTAIGVCVLCCIIQARFGLLFECSQCLQLFFLLPQLHFQHFHFSYRGGGLVILELARFCDVLLDWFFIWEHITYDNATKRAYPNLCSSQIVRSLSMSSSENTLFESETLLLPLGMIWNSFPIYTKQYAKEEKSKAWCESRTRLCPKMRCSLLSPSLVCEWVKAPLTADKENRSRSSERILHSLEATPTRYTRSHVWWHFPNLSRLDWTFHVFRITNYSIVKNGQRPYGSSIPQRFLLSLCPRKSVHLDLPGYIHSTIR